MVSTITLGTITVTNGSATITGSGTNWLTTASGAGFVAFVQSGTLHLLPFVTVNSDTEIAAVLPFQGTTEAGLSYSLIPVGEQFSSTVSLNQRLAALVAAMEANAGLLGVSVDKVVADLTARAAYDDEAEGYKVMVLDCTGETDGTGRAAIYVMGSGGSADWLGPAYTSGAKGDQGDAGSSDVVGTSATSRAIGTGAKAFTVAETGRGWGVGARLRASSDADGANFMEGVVTAYSGTSLTISVDLVGGSGTLDDWTINVAGEPGADGAGSVDSVNGKAGVVVLDPDDLDDSATINKFASAGQLAKVDYLTVTGAVDLDAINTRVNDLDAAVVLRGSWDASAGSFPGSGTAQAGDSYIVSVAGTVDSAVFAVGDRIIAITDNASTSTYASNWLKLDYTDLVSSVNGQTGAVVLNLREVLTANRTYYVDGGSGSDSNDGLSSGAGAFATIQKAIDVTASLDISTYSVTIYVADGTYTAAVVLKTIIGSGNVTIEGNTTTPSNCIISLSSLHCFYNATGAVGRYTIQGFKVVNSNGNGMRFNSNNLSVIIDDIDFGACSSVHIYLQNGASLNCEVKSYTISGNAYIHWLGQGHASLAAYAANITLSGTPAFSGKFAGADYLSHFSVAGITFTGSATGKRYEVNGNSVLDTNGGGAAYLPGNSAGSTATGGQYI